MSASISLSNSQRTSQPDNANRIRLADVSEIAEILGCSTAHVRRLSDAGAMPQPVRLGAMVRWNLKSIDEWIQSGCPNLNGRRK